MKLQFRHVEFELVPRKTHITSSLVGSKQHGYVSMEIVVRQVDIHEINITE